MVIYIIIMILEYRKINGYPDYIISNNGIVWSTKYGKVREMKPSLGKNGYKKVALCKDGIHKTMRIHVLVGIHFVGPRIGELTYDHYPDTTKTNNRADNIRLATKSQQAINQKLRITNKLGEKNISTYVDKKNGRQYYEVQIKRNKKVVFRKLLNKKKYTLEDAVKLRDDFLITL